MSKMKNQIKMLLLIVIIIINLMNPQLYKMLINSMNYKTFKINFKNVYNLWI